MRLAGPPGAPFGEAAPMPSLRQILREASPLLLVDAASTRIQAGVLASSASARWSSSAEEAGVALFDCLDSLDVDLGSIRGFAFCEGPGSILGARTSAMAVRTWNALRPRPTFGYLSLALVARALGRPGVAVIADARRGRWHRFADGGPSETVPASELSGETVTPEGFRHWQPLPPGTTEVGYVLASLFAQPAVAEADLFRATDDPDAFLPRAPSYATWTPQIHRAP
jgi:tRNA threonylcarbamoyladenosine biosynthesis protein TsaB